MPVIVNCSTGPFATTPIVVADRVALLVGRRRRRSRPRPGRTASEPSVSSSGLKRCSSGSMPKASGGAPRVEITSPFFFVSCAKSLMPPAAASTSGSAWTSSSSASGNGGGCPKSVVNASLPVMTASVPAYDSREDVVERLVDRVGEDVRAADHRDAEHDRERGEDRAELAPGEALEGDGDHRPASSFIAASTSGALERPTSLTIEPVGEEEDAVGHRGRARLVGHHQRRLAVACRPSRGAARGSRRPSSSRGCRSARRRRAPSASRRARARSRRAAAGRPTAPPGGGCGGRRGRPCR